MCVVASHLCCQNNVASRVYGLYGISGQVVYLIVSVPGLCLHLFFYQLTKPSILDGFIRLYMHTLFSSIIKIRLTIISIEACPWDNDTFELS